MSMSAKEVRNLQSHLNAFTKKRLLDVAPLIVDGKHGAATRKRTRLVGYYLGLAKGKRATVNAEYLARLHHPKSLRVYGARSLQLAITRRARQRRLARAERRKLTDWRNRGGFAIFDGKTVAAWMVFWLERSRANGWQGVVVSGVRTPEHSEELCFAMCGAPRCPGRCAGRASNHNMSASQGFPAGALDVSDFANFGRIQKQIGSPLVNHLGAQDPVHFSFSGR